MYNMAMPHKESKMDSCMDKAEKIGEMSKSGEMEGQEEINPTYITFEKEMFPQLAGDGEGDKVVVVLSGKVIKVLSDEVAVIFDSASVVHGKMPKLGSGERFKRLSAELEGKGAENPGALAAYIGRKKYGKAKFQKLAEGK